MVSLETIAEVVAGDVEELVQQAATANQVGYLRLMSELINRLDLNLEDTEDDE